MTKPELLAPAGNFEKLQVALIYGADAVYFGGGTFKKCTNNFRDVSLSTSRRYCRAETF